MHDGNVHMVRAQLARSLQCPQFEPQCRGVRAGFLAQRLQLRERFAVTRGRGRMPGQRREDVLALTYTAHDMAAFAKDLGYVDKSGEVLAPFVWDEAERRCRLPPAAG